MTDIVEQDSGLSSLYLHIKKIDTLFHERPQGFLHQVEGSDGMLLPRVLRTRIDQRRHTELTDAAEALKKGMGNDIRQQTARDARETVNGIIDD